jgi:poly-beta-1,6-N-acetyl-D-glucosamine N-deacetylase
LDTLIPLATANDALNPEKFPGPWLIKTVDRSSSFILISIRKSKICFINKSLLDLSLCKSLKNDLVLYLTNREPETVLQSIDKKFIVFKLILILVLTSKSFAFNISNINTNSGIITLMYHRFEENKYPSTNIKKEIFIKHIETIKSLDINFIDFKKFEEIIKTKIDKNYVLLTVDDGFESFYLNAWPILKERKIPFILFVNTREVGKNGYMTWDQIKEIAKSDLVTIGNHSHTHEYLVDLKDHEIKDDIEKAIKIFKKEIGFSPKIFSYPFGEYSNNFKKIVSELGFEFAFGQHSGVIDPSKNFLELPRFPINEKYGELKRFKSILNTLPFPYENIFPDNRYLVGDENPPEITIKFYKNLINIKNINCYSNEENVWKKSEIKFINEDELRILLRGKFESERGRINCSLWAEPGKWRWLGVQYVIAEY